ARADWDIIAEVGRRMGWQDAFDYANEADVFREYAALSGQAAEFGRDFDISGLAAISDADYDDFAPQVWPVPAKGKGKTRFFADGGFFHPGGRAKMLAITPPVLDAQADTGLRFNTGRVRDHWHTMTRTGRAPQLASHMAEPYLEVHPLDAARLGLEVAGLAKVKSAHGEVILRVLITDRVQLGQCFAPMHWTGETASAGRINALVTGDVDPVSGQPALKGMTVAVTPYAVGWYGFAASVVDMVPARPYAAVARSKTGWRAEVAGHKIPQDWQQEARQILNLPEGELSIVEDHARTTVRVAIYQHGKLAGVFFAAPEPVELMRSQVVEQIGSDIPALRVLAGLAPSDQPAKGAIVCACMDVGRDELRRAIGAGADSVPRLVECTGAGSNCGSCRPELAALVAEFTTQKVAAQ
ncbi:nitrate reductase, partial [Epibacterium sp. SM1969]